MRKFKDIKSHYDFSEADEKRLKDLKPIMTENAARVMDDLHSWIMTTPESAAYFTVEKVKEHVTQMREVWFHDLFSGPYDSRYYERLIRVGQKHVQSGVEPHWLNRGMNLVRNSCLEILNRHFENPGERLAHLQSLEKLLDINLDVITSSFIEEEIRTYSPAYRVKSALLTFSERFSQFMNLVLVLALMGLTIGVTGLFVRDVFDIFHGQYTHGIITALGSLLILWVMIELMNTEIAHLKGGKIGISVFIGVGLVTTIRDVLIKTLKHEEPGPLYFLGALILVLGLVYWLVRRSEEQG
ncbi:MAG: phosphate-starvation-inducible PsiE family protein, partial [Deltaproteobacteria bacterium]|nr:phosphate-starvation-inducible PsiE family protein [Deltaproteobacteria bacterium]